LRTGLARNSFELILLVSLLLLSGCAQQVAPTGGLADEEPPKILESSPLNESTNFEGSSIELEFDEFVQLRDASSKLIVSPPLEEPVVFTLRGKKVTVEWTDTLDDNTTYMFQFGEGIVDLHESNPLDSNIFVFSTGPYLDSMELKGVVKNALDLNPAEGVWVMLYDQNIDSLPLTELPRYFAKTNKQGIYHLKYLRPGDYKIFALQSEGQGYTYDKPEELIAFEDQLVSAVEPGLINPLDSGEFVGPSMLLFQEVDSTQYVDEYLLSENKVLILKMNMPVEELTLTDLTGNDISSWVKEWGQNKDSVAFWFDSVMVADSLYLRLETDQGFIDTLNIRKRSSSKGKFKKKAKGLGLAVSGQGRQDFFKPLTIKASEPVADLMPEHWILRLDSDTLDITGLVTTDFKTITLDFPWQQESTYQLLIPDSTIYGKYGKTNDTLKYSYTVTSREDYGQMTFNLDFQGYSEGLVWQLYLGEKLKDERVVRTKASIRYDYLKPGKYQIRAIFDTNGNGAWDTGNYKSKLQPEKVIYYEELIEVRSNWEEEIEWQYLFQKTN